MKIKIPDSVVEAVLTRERVEGAPHDFYRYPARFSPLFAREVIRAFTRKGDVVVDPFCGSGTTAVEAISLGRRAIATDVNALAVFLARTKTSALSLRDKRTILEWLDSLSVEPARVVGHDLDYYTRNLPAGTKAFFESIIARLDQLPKQRQRNFARLALLSVGQGAVDCKTGEPSWAVLHDQFVLQLRATLD